MPVFKVFICYFAALGLLRCSDTRNDAALAVKTHRSETLNNIFQNRHNLIWFHA
ncbi:hypothetical protein D1BOALGB6SA_3285 [Olavius sp. associated proteobacterium Delta 1]|nr:hypothetical protein D1BOALGB6SA_3285 [Olavius sp. associated proteobacterium Delta 1]